LEAAGEQDRGLGAGQFGEAGLDGAVLGQVAADEARGGRAAGRLGEIGEARVVGEAEVVVAAEADDRPAVERVCHAMAGCDLGRCPGETGALKRVEAGAKTAFEGSGHERALDSQRRVRSYCVSVAASNERSLQALLASRVEAMGLRAELPWVKLEELGSSGCASGG
jgi:hypothetical protein